MNEKRSENPVCSEHCKDKSSFATFLERLGGSRSEEETIMPSIELLRDKVIAGSYITPEEALWISRFRDAELLGLFAAASGVRQHFRGDIVDLCAIVNAKSGACSEDCSYCPQSSKASTGIDVYPLLEKSRIIEKATEAKNPE